MVLEWPQAGAPLHPSHRSMYHKTQLSPPESDGHFYYETLFSDSPGKQPSAQAKVPCLPIDPFSHPFPPSQTPTGLLCP